MSILMLDRYLTVGGVTTYLKVLCRGMIEKGHTVSLMTAADNANLKIRDEFASYGIQIITIPNAENRFAIACRFLEGMYQFLKENRVDVIHSHHRLVNFAGIFVSKMYSIPHLITLHVFKDDHRLLTTFLKSEWITVPSKALKNHLINYYGFKKERVDVIYNSIGTDYNIDKKKLDSLQKKIFNDPEKFYVGYIGRISYEKGVDILLESIPLVQAQCPNVEFLIFGDGAQRSHLKQRCRELQLNSDRIFHGTNYHVNELLSLMEVCVLPSRSENFSLVVLECMRAQKPVIASNVGGIPEAVIDGKTGLLVEAEDAKELSEGIIKLYKNPSLRERFGKHGYERFIENFPLEKFYKEYGRKYRSLMPTSPAPVT